MLVSEDAARHFISLYTMLLYYAGQQRRKLPAKMSFDDFLDTPMQTKIECRHAVYEPSPLIDDFLKANSDILSEEEQKIINAWARHHVRGMFIIFRHLKKHSIFFDGESPHNVYAALGLTTELGDIFPGWALPLIVGTVLVPYQGVIVCDGLISTNNMMIGPNMRREMNEEYKELKSAGRLIMTLGD